MSHRARENFGAIKDAASGYIDQGREKAAAMGRTVEGQVKEWPLSALLVATGVGLLLGVILARRSALRAERTAGRIMARSKNIVTGYDYGSRSAIQQRKNMPWSSSGF